MLQSPAISLSSRRGRPPFAVRLAASTFMPTTFHYRDTVTPSLLLPIATPAQTHETHVSQKPIPGLPALSVFRNLRASLNWGMMGCG